MEPTNQFKRTAQSRCIYCSSPSYGKGCRYGPHGTHFHPEDGTKCAYCGSPSYGRGCRLNPTSDLHVHGINYNSMFKENIQSFLDSNLLLNELKKPFCKFRAFDLGIINEQGNKIKEPVTEEEIASYGPFVKTILKLKKYLGSKIDLIEANNSLQKNNLFVEDIVQYKKILNYKDKVDNIVNQLFVVIEEAQLEGLSLDEIQKLFKA